MANKLPKDPAYFDALLQSHSTSSSVRSFKQKTLSNFLVKSDLCATTQTQSEKAANDDKPTYRSMKKFTFIKVLLENYIPFNQLPNFTAVAYDANKIKSELITEPEIDLTLTPELHDEPSVKHSVETSVSNISVKANTEPKQFTFIKPSLTPKVHQSAPDKNPLTDDNDTFILSNIDWDEEDIQLSYKNQTSTTIDSKEITPISTGVITRDDYIDDDDFDLSILHSPGSPSDHISTDASKTTNNIINLNSTFNVNSTLAGPSSGMQQFIPIDKDQNSRKDDTASFKKSYPHTTIARDILHEKFGLKEYRPNQEEIINAALEQFDCFVLMPTGGGKSLCYQLPAILTPGVTIVVSPLRALIVDQVNKLTTLDIPAAHMCADITKSEYARIMSLLSELEPGLKILYLTPEKIIGSKATFDMLISLYNRGKLSRFVLDEAHCLSQWGHDFRPDYKQLSTLRKQFPRTPIMCLTATATNVVQQDVTNVLKLNNVKTFIRSFNRPNIKYCVLGKTKAIATIEIIKLLKLKFNRMSGIVYCLCRKDCDTLALDLRRNGIKALSYHAGLSDAQRTKVQTQWMNNESHVICATIAFGMGIDKPDVRFVIHNSLPKSVEGFYQESGRGGRDGEIAYSFLYYSYGDVVRLQKIIKMDKSITSKKNLDAHFDQINQMAQYCENRTDCRRYLQLLHLGEKFDRRLCLQDSKTMCDNCQNFGNVTLQDVSKECKELATIVKDIGTNRNFTMLHFCDVYKGSTIKKIIDFKHNTHKYYGAGKHLNKTDIHRIMKQLSYKKVLIDICTFNGEFPAIHVKPGPNYHTIFDKNTTITIPVSSGSSNKASIKEVQTNNVTPLPGTSTVSPIKKTPSMIKPKKVQPVKKESNNNDMKIFNIKTKCHEELLEKCAEFAGQMGSNLSSIMNLSAIKTMSDQLPSCAADFMKIQYVTKANYEKFGNAFLSITQKYRNELDKIEAEAAIADFVENDETESWDSSPSITPTKSPRTGGVKRKFNRYKRTNKRRFK